MSGFSTAWLDLREPFDHAARSAPLALRFLAALPATPRLVDLGGGTGSTIRYLERLAACRWTLVDGDPGLLAVAAARHPGVTPCRRDLREPLDPLFAAADGVTASALLDLVSRAWLDGLVSALAARRLPALLALSVDRQLRFDPPDRDDGFVRRAFLRHMAGDKGLGPALGPDATAAAGVAFRARGYRVAVRRSDWRLGEADSAIRVALLDGIAGAAAEIEPAAAARIAAWRANRSDAAILVGHHDLLALPSSTA